MDLSSVLLLAEAESNSLGVIMAVVAVVMAVVKIFERVIDYFVAELQRRRKTAAAAQESGSGEVAALTDSGKFDAPTREIISKIAKYCAELHAWHTPEVPGQPGVKVWWNTEEEKRRSREMDAKIDQLVVALQQHATVEELRQRVDELQELRLTDRDTLYERVIQVTEAFAARIERGVDPSSNFGQAGSDPESE